MLLRGLRAAPAPSTRTAGWRPATSAAGSRRPAHVRPRGRPHHLRRRERVAGPVEADMRDLGSSTSRSPARPTPSGVSVVARLVVPTDDGPPTLDDVRCHMKATLPAFCAPRLVPRRTSPALPSARPRRTELRPYAAPQRRCLSPRALVSRDSTWLEWGVDVGPTGFGDPRGQGDPSARAGRRFLDDGLPAPRTALDCGGADQQRRPTAHALDTSEVDGPDHGRCNVDEPGQQPDVFRAQALGQEGAKPRTPPST